MSHTARKRIRRENTGIAVVALLGIAMLVSLEQIVGASATSRVDVYGAMPMPFSASAAAVHNAAPSPISTIAARLKQRLAEQKVPGCVITVMCVKGKKPMCVNGKATCVDQTAASASTSSTSGQRCPAGQQLLPVTCVKGPPAHCTYRCQTIPLRKGGGY